MARENTILHSTSTLDIHLDESQLPDGLVARTPSSVNSNNEIFDSSSRRRRASFNDPNADDGLNDTMSRQSRSRDSTYTGTTNNNDNQSEGGDDIGTMSRAGSRASVMSSGTSMSDMSKTTGSVNINSKGKLGSRSLLTLRLKGEILALDAVSSLQTPSADSSSLSLLPSPWLQTIVSQSVISADIPYVSDIYKQSDAVIPFPLTHVGGDYPMETIYEQAKAVKEAANEIELRALTESVLKDVFSYIFDMSSTQAYTRSVIMEATASQAGMRLRPMDDTSNAESTFPVEGKPGCDIYYSLIHNDANVDSNMSAPKAIDTNTADSSILTESEVTIRCQDMISDAITKSVLDIFFEMTNTHTALN